MQNKFSIAFVAFFGLGAQAVRQMYNMDSSGFTNDYSKIVPSQTIDEPDECDSGPSVTPTSPTAPPNIILQIDNTSHYGSNARKDIKNDDY